MAGGLSRRMGGGDKCQLKLQGKTLLQRVIERASPQVDTLVLNANGDASRFSSYQLPVISDCVEGFVGPLAGILTGMSWVREHFPDCEWVASFASDTPFFPQDLVQRLLSSVAEQQGDLACAVSDGRRHPVFGLWPVRLYDDLYRTLVKEETRKMGAWIARYRCTEVNYDCQPIDPFFNINTPEELELAQKIV